MNAFDKTEICELCGEDYQNGHSCRCAVCEGSSPVKVKARGSDEYIVCRGQVVLRYGAPVGGSENAFYRLHEDSDLNPDSELPSEKYISLALQGELWPEKPGIYNDDDAVDMYRLLKSTKAF